MHFYYLLKYYLKALPTHFVKIIAAVTFFFFFVLSFSKLLVTIYGFVWTKLRFFLDCSLLLVGSYVW